ncbi:AAA family ATPase [Catenulispora subtropica]|uniref:AAA family ATPase n=1 Tax=Catenulispora subtropica TaxID=450798 RepID=A0ABP5E821_9ACTN
MERDAELEAIAGSVAAAGRGEGSVLVVEGPAGVGKSRILQESATAADLAGMRVLTARCSELEQAFAFGVVRQLFETALASADAREREVLLAGAAARTASVFEREASEEPPAGDFVVLHGLYWLVSNLCRRRDLALLIDDLQWCDTPSLRFLVFLSSRFDGLRLLVVAGRRSVRVGTDALADQILADPATVILRPKAFSASATAQFLSGSLTGPVDPLFASTCHRATAGNPLLLRELVRTLIAEGIAPDAAAAGRVLDLGSRAVGRLVALRMARVSASGVALAQAVAVLGDRIDLGTAAGASFLDGPQALESAAELERLEILSITKVGGVLSLEFVHPLVRAAVYESMDVVGSGTAHARAAKLLAASGAGVERIAAHLLHVPANASQEVVSLLRSAAAEAVRRGCPDGAYTYLRRALQEPPDDTSRLAVLEEAGRAAFLVDHQGSADLLQQVYDRTTDRGAAADLAILLGTAYLWLLEPDRGISVLSDALAHLPPDQEDRRRRLYAGLLDATWIAPVPESILRGVPALRELPAHDSIGGRLLDCAIACFDMAGGDPSATDRARLALADGSVVEEANGEGALLCGWLALLAADDDAAMVSMGNAVTNARQTGSIHSLAPAYTFQSLGWLWRGQLAEAEHDAREARRLAHLAGLDLNDLFGDAYLAAVLMEQGDLDEAEETLRSIGVTVTGHPVGPAYFALDAHARLRRLRGDNQGAVDAAATAGRAWAAFGFTNPAMGSWRSEAALALHALNRTGDAHEIAEEGLDLARRWGRPRALGRALRTSGLLYGNAEGLDLLSEAVAVLEDSSARLEHAYALADLGAALRRSGSGGAARHPLRQALELATHCGAAPLAAYARTELIASGARPRRVVQTGPHALTPSERRIAELAAQHATNRQIAQQLFVTPKTVELHLSSVFRKLGISTRTSLSAALAQ